MAQMLSPMASSMVGLRNGAAQAMALRLAETGSGQFTPEVKNFQVAWNQALGATREQLAFIGMTASQISQIAVPLDEDGKFGPKTSGALYAIVGDPRPPTKASGMPVWVAANMSTLATLVPPTEVPTADIISPEVIIDSNPQVQPSTGGKVVVEAVGGSTTAGPEPVIPAAPLDIAMMEAEEPPPLEYEAIPVEITTTRAPTRVPVVAVLLGVAALGGGFYLITRGRKRRRLA